MTGARAADFAAVPPHDLRAITRSRAQDRFTFVLFLAKLLPGHAQAFISFHVIDYLYYTTRRY